MEVALGFVGGEDSSIYRLKQGGVIADAVSNISQLTAEKLAASTVQHMD